MFVEPIEAVVSKIMNTTPFVRRVVIQNYKSIASTDVAMRQLTFLVGPNGAGKSNFIDALRFVADALRTSLDNALRERGGINEVRRRSSGHPTHFGMRLEFTLPSGTAGHYSFLIGALAKGGYEVQKEECLVQEPDGQRHYFTARKGKIESNFDSPPAGFPDRLYLVNVSGLRYFRSVYDAFSNMGFYNLNPQVVRELQAPESGDLLLRDGSNLTSVIARMTKSAVDRKNLIEEYLSKVARDIRGVEATAVGPKETLEFRQDVAGAKSPWRFFASNMSDGTLRALGVLVALFQSDHDSTTVPLVGIEEPEAALHPAAAGVLLDALREASGLRQVIVTSHSPDLLDNDEIQAEEIYSVTSTGGVTHIAPIDDAGRDMLRGHLYTAGELLRMNQLTAQAELFDEPSKATQYELFDIASEKSER